MTKGGWNCDAENSNNSSSVTLFWGGWYEKAGEKLSQESEPRERLKTRKGANTGASGYGISLLCSLTSVDWLAGVFRPEEKNGPEKQGRRRR